MEVSTTKQTIYSRSVQRYCAHRILERETLPKRADVHRTPTQKLYVQQRAKRTMGFKKQRTGVRIKPAKIQGSTNQIVLC